MLLPVRIEINNIKSRIAQRIPPSPSSNDEILRMILAKSQLIYWPALYIEDKLIFLASLLVV